MNSISISISLSSLLESLQLMQSIASQLAPQSEASQMISQDDAEVLEERLANIAIQKINTLLSQVSEGVNISNCKAKFPQATEQLPSFMEGVRLWGILNKFFNYRNTEKFTSFEWGESLRFFIAEWIACHGNTVKDVPESLIDSLCAISSKEQLQAFVAELVQADQAGEFNEIGDCLKQLATLPIAFLDVRLGLLLQGVIASKSKFLRALQGIPVGKSFTVEKSIQYAILLSNEWGQIPVALRITFYKLLYKKEYKELLKILRQPSAAGEMDLKPLKDLIHSLFSEENFSLLFCTFPSRLVFQESEDLPQFLIKNYHTLLQQITVLLREQSELVLDSQHSIMQTAMRKSSSVTIKCDRALVANRSTQIKLLTGASPTMSSITQIKGMIDRLQKSLNLLMKSVLSCLVSAQDSGEKGLVLTVQMARILSKAELYYRKDMDQLISEFKQSYLLLVGPPEMLQEKGIKLTAQQRTWSIRLIENLHSSLVSMLDASQFFTDQCILMPAKASAKAASDPQDLERILFEIGELPPTLSPPVKKIRADDEQKTLPVERVVVRAVAVAAAALPEKISQLEPLFDLPIHEFKLSLQQEFGAVIAQKELDEVTEHLTFFLQGLDRYRQLGLEGRLPQFVIEFLIIDLYVCLERYLSFSILKRGVEVNKVHSLLGLQRQSRFLTSPEQEALLQRYDQAWLWLRYPKEYTPGPFATPLLKTAPHETESINSGFKFLLEDLSILTSILLPKISEDHRLTENIALLDLTPLIATAEAPKTDAFNAVRAAFRSTPESAIKEGLEGLVKFYETIQEARNTKLSSASTFEFHRMRAQLLEGHLFKQLFSFICKLRRVDTCLTHSLKTYINYLQSNEINLSLEPAETALLRRITVGPTLYYSSGLRSDVRSLLELDSAQEREQIQALEADLAIAHTIIFPKLLTDVVKFIRQSF